MRKSDRFTYTAGATGISVSVPGMVRYGVIVAEVDEDGRSGNTAEFFVVFQDTGDAQRNEDQAIGQARNMAFMIANSGPALPE